MRRLPLDFKAGKVAAHLLAPLAHHVVELRKLSHLARFRVESEAVLIQHRREARARHAPAAHTRVPTCM